MTRKPDDRMDKELRHLELVPVTGPEERVRDACVRLQAARVEFAETFLRQQAAWKGLKPLTDRQAHEMAIAATGDEITAAQTELDLAMWLMRESSVSE